MNTRDWYSGKTQSIIEKYGGLSPRVHYHLGFALPEDELLPVRERMHRSQERLLEESFAYWLGDARLCGRVLDSGCGLGGTSFWMAERYDVAVTALTNIAEHATEVERRARDLKLNVETLVSTAETFVSEHKFDTVVCFEAANLFDREAWFNRLNIHVRPGSRLLIDDYFIADPALKAEFDKAFSADIGVVLSYISMAEKHGWTLDRSWDVSQKSAAFWRWCAEYADSEPHKGWHQTGEFHRYMYEAQRRGAYRHALLSFVKREEST